MTSIRTESGTASTGSVAEVHQQQATETKTKSKKGQQADKTTAGSGENQPTSLENVPLAPRPRRLGDFFYAAIQNYSTLLRCMTSMKQAIASAKRLDLIATEHGIKFFLTNANKTMLMYTYFTTAFFTDFAFHPVLTPDGQTTMRTAIACVSFQEFIDYLNSLEEKTVSELQLYDNSTEGTIIADPILTKETQYRSLVRLFEGLSADNNVQSMKSLEHRIIIKIPIAFINRQLRNWTNNPWVRFSYAPKTRLLSIRGYNDIRVTTDPVIALLPEQIITNPKCSMDVDSLPDGYAVETTVRGSDLKTLRHLNKLNPTITMSWDNDTPLSVRVPLDSSGESTMLNSFVELRIQGFVRRQIDLPAAGEDRTSVLTRNKARVEHSPVPLIKLRSAVSMQERADAEDRERSESTTGEETKTGARKRGQKRPASVLSSTVKTTKGRHRKSVSASSSAKTRPNKSTVREQSQEDQYDRHDDDEDDHDNDADQDDNARGAGADQEDDDPEEDQGARAQHQLDSDKDGNPRPLKRARLQSSSDPSGTVE
jgi:hypothetical protein